MAPILWDGRCFLGCWTWRVVRHSTDNVSVRNTTLLAKCLWWFYHEVDTLWVKVMVNKYAVSPLNRMLIRLKALIENLERYFTEFQFLSYLFTLLWGTGEKLIYTTRPFIYLFWETTFHWNLRPLKGKYPPAWLVRRSKCLKRLKLNGF